LCALIFQHQLTFQPICCSAFAAGRKSDVDAVFKNAASMGMTAARTWAHSISEQFPFQTAPGKYDEQGLQVRALVINK
jgi:hypothetical protein